MAAVGTRVPGSGVCLPQLFFAFGEHPKAAPQDFPSSRALSEPRCWLVPVPVPVSVPVSVAALTCPPRGSPRWLLPPSGHCGDCRVSSEMLKKIPILKNLRSRDQQTGKDVTLQNEHSELVNANTSAALTEKMMAEKTRPEAARNSAQRGQRGVESDSLSPRLEGSGMITTVYVGNIPPSLRVRELKCALREFHATPLRVNWQGAQHRAFLDYKDKATAESAVSSLKGLSLGGNTLQVELAKNQRNKGQVEINSQK
ncbi:methenyltetrahydrofolate synthase domain-containing protein [Calypte anna]|uniref:methenyltetrahydrofolate synthase domain-containing protein n=1 Tax=Calypte anna TaxID=9244 RepID=UPI0011C43A67|nr:methenyltetrahydrofolate synthase domain-containing protein [Calypte anna]